ncbi:hypothetical protein KP509_03G090300 [Ceratopteris richardii]|uniref:Uncharacterized protein n=1 Tax=Ceratopteris richardii TaxID=49495 RepID=A0A8T2V4Y6_CERRI|nr:hypothetical protein KP509_03G090300 [Ceratopteris richardii]KAH7442466.1 hypothetical protein KP509_03G090300 [Ceratopteris richardii]KAH7442467.1 hypothetical protein KP509_03G090300 [Ceratopteris richardii]KAH7442468.1 hypothetical protein KP509_03G090300 [Ceratopteris richardii]KAH7442469.1 hypothetical protein KP509_03G090300 [Ceratopteris richardii]
MPLISFCIKRMGVQASTNKSSGGKQTSDTRKKNTKKEKVRIEILAFEVASVMSKSVQLWQSLSDLEVRRFRAEVMKSEGVLNLVSDNECVLLSLACLEKLQDLTAVAFAVSRLGKKCHEHVLVGFEHIFNDLLKQVINVQELEFSQKEMEAKIKKMERYITTTSNLYLELEALAEMERAIRRLKEEGDPAHKENIFALEQKVVWQKQEVKYLEEVSLWNRTYDKIVGLLARTVCTIYGRIIKVFGFPIMGWPQVLSVSRNGEIDYSGSLTSCLSTEEPKVSNDSMNGCMVSTMHSNTTGTTHALSLSEPWVNSQVSSLNGSASLTRDRSISIPPLSSTFSPVPSRQTAETHMSLSLCFSPGRQFSQRRSMSVNYASRDDDSVESSPSGTPIHENFSIRTGDTTDYLLTGNGPFDSMSNKGANKLHFDPKTKLQNAPPSTLGGAGLALHYANVVIIAEKMVRYPHLISQDAREDLYHMLPKNVRMALRARLRPCMRMCTSPGYDGSGGAEWKEAFERALSWLTPLAHNMVRWQSEHNFEQQQFVPRTNVLLLQTLYFADRVKTEAAIAELLVGLNFLWRYERESKAHSLMEYASNKDLEEYLEWQL